MAAKDGTTRVKVTLHGAILSKIVSRKIDTCVTWQSIYYNNALKQRCKNLKSVGALEGFQVMFKYETEDFTGISKSECFLKRRAFLMHGGFVIPVKSDVEYLNWLLKPTSTLKYFKGTSTFKYFKGTSTLKYFKGTSTLKWTVLSS